MPKMNHDFGGLVRPIWTTMTVPAAPLRGRLIAIGESTARGRWKYPVLRRKPQNLWLAIFISLNAHLLLFFGFNRDEAPRETAGAADDSPVIQIAMPDLKDLEEEKPVEELSDAEADPDPGVAVPMLAEAPTIVPMDAITQKVDYRPPVEADLSGPKLKTVPLKIARGAGAEKLGKVFDLSQLDRAPEPIVQPPPVFPSNLKREYSEATVTIGFIVNAKGEVVAPYVVASTYFGFEEPALKGLEKWKFRPGVKNGRKVNTRMQIDIKFRIREGNPA